LHRSHKSSFVRPFTTSQSPFFEQLTSWQNGIKQQAMKMTAQQWFKSPQDQDIEKPFLTRPTPL